jgi:hypothetical protein
MHSPGQLCLLACFQAVANTPLRLAPQQMKTDSAKGYTAVAPDSVGTFFPLVSEFVVANPLARAGVVQLTVRRASVPPRWQILLESVDSTVQLNEIDRGQRYQLSLAGGAVARLVGVVIPSEPPATDVSVRWTVEASINDSSIGGMVFAVNDPEARNSLILPSKGSVESKNALIWIVIAAGAALLAILAAIRSSYRRRRRSLP